MKKKNIFIFVITLILIVIAAFLMIRQSNGTFGGKMKDFAVRDTASITKVFLADKSNNTILLERKAPGDWLLNRTYRARNTGINLLFETFVNIVPKFPVPKKAHNNVITQLAARSVKVEIYQKVFIIDLFGIRIFPHEKLTKTYYVGGATQDNMGTFMLMEGAEVPFVVHLLGFRGFIAPRFSTQEKEWRDHTVFRTRLNDISSITLEIPAKPDNSFKIINENGEVHLLQLNIQKSVQNYDTLKVLNFMTAFNDLRYEALLNDINPARRDSIIESTPSYILTVIDTKGNTTVMKTFNKPNDQRRFDIEGNLYVMDVDRAYALVNKDRDFVLIQYFVFDKVLKPLSYFILNE
jgi:hypothetical protein